MTHVKICGLTNEQDLAAAVDAGADAVGVIADVPVDSPREVGIDRAVDLVAAAPPFVTTVLVTMPQAPTRAVELADRVEPDVLQLHGDLPVGDVAHVAANADVSVVKTVDAAAPRGGRYDDVVDALLVDSVDGEGAGGTGQTHDWAATRDFVDLVESPVVLAGGLTPENVAEAVDVVDPYAVDVATGVEAAGGEKDHEAVEAFVANAKRDSTVVEQ
jgi:phosphoribosylanthranilate isomerase